MATTVHIVREPAARARLTSAHAFIEAHADIGVLVVGATRAAADELVLGLAKARGAIAAVTRMSFAELAMKLALPILGDRLTSPAGTLGAEAIATRATFDASDAGELEYFEPVAQLPGFPRAAARTLAELQLAVVTRERLAAVDAVGGDLAALLDRAGREATRAGVVSRADTFAAAVEHLRRSPAALVSRHLLCLDVAVTSAAERALLHAVVDAASVVLATVPSGDTFTEAAWLECGAVVRPSASADPATAPPPALGRLQTWLFSPETPPDGALDESVRVFSAPGEGREAVEVARRILHEAAGGVRFDEMAVLLRAPQTYAGLLEHAFARAGIPAWFERGTRRPDPAGRAFLSLLACADEGLSARRFAEYLSLAQVPGTGPNPEGTGPRQSMLGPVPDVIASTDDLAAALIPPDARPEDPAPIDEAPPAGDGAGGVVAGTLRAPWRWEELLVEAYVIQGLDRWRRRLPGLRSEYDRRLKELADEDQDSPRLRALERDREELGYLQAFALPIVEALDGWHEPRTWGEWLRAFEQLVPQVLRQPARVLRVFGDMAPLATVGPIPLREVRDVLAARLLSATHEPPRRRHGSVFVGTPHAARGRTFRTVFVPGLAERIFPQRLREDALLLDARRVALDPALAVADTRAADERLYLRLAVGAATDRVHLSYPRLELAESRPRVPSFYVLDVLRATTGAIPRYKALSDHAFVDGNASLAWPAPAEPDTAIDEMEHDLAMLRPLLREPAAESARANGRARYLLELNPSLRRSMVERWARWQKGTHPADGLNRVVDLTRPALAQARLTARPYSLTALQRFAVCPYQFQLAAMCRLAPLEAPAPLQRLDPLTKGSLFHEIQTEFLRALQKNGMLPLTAGRVSTARQMLEWAIGAVTEKARDELVPAIERVWKDEIAGMRRDLQGWLEGLERDGTRWTPERFELAFGLTDDYARDPASTRDPVAVGEAGYLLRGSIDLVERRVGGRALRVTDHKTGKNRTTPATIVDGGRVLQPVLYAVALEAITGDPVEEGRLAFCTASGGFAAHTIVLDPIIRARGLEVLAIIDRAIEQGTLAARPGRVGTHSACEYCDFRPVCGPDEPDRTKRKPPLPDLEALRRFS